MADTIEKQSDTVVRITKDIPAQMQVASYNIDLLVSQKKSIEADILVSQAALTRVKDLIAKAASVGVEPILVEKEVTEEVVEA